MGEPWYKALWHLVDGTLRSISDGLQAVLRGLRIARVVLVLLILFVLATAIFTIFYPQYSHYVLAGVLFVLMLPLIVALGLVMLPFRAKSVVRLVDKGYPENVKELTIRAAARKLHDESIETEQLLVDTAVNEARKAARKYRTRLETLKAELDAMEDALEHDVEEEGASGAAESGPGAGGSSPGRGKRDPGPPGEPAPGSGGAPPP